jgi:hypothetical protein
MVMKFMDRMDIVESFVKDVFLSFLFGLTIIAIFMYMPIQKETLNSLVMGFLYFATIYYFKEFIFAVVPYIIGAIGGVYLIWEMLNKNVANNELIGLLILAVGIGLISYFPRKMFMKHLEEKYC